MESSYFLILPLNSDTSHTLPLALVLGFDISHLEIQKLAYFLQEFGQQDLKLRFEKGHYRPYATNLKHLIVHLGGSYIKGQIRFQDMKPTDALTLVEKQLSNVHTFLDENLEEDEKIRLDKVKNLIEGFESPYGLELLATVHWAKKQLQKQATGFSIKNYIDNWSSRKKELMAQDQVSIA